MARRTQPLHASTHDAPAPAVAAPLADDAPHLTGAAAEAEAEMAALAGDVVLGGAVPATSASADPHAEAKRMQRLADGVRQLRVGGGALKLNERLLLVLGGVLAPLGLVLVLVGWNGAASTPNLFEQIPYAISGGLFGLGLVFLGSFCYFAHWMTELVKEHRAQSAAIVEAITRLEDVLRPHVAPVAAAPLGPPPADDEVVETFDFAPEPSRNGVALVATEKGTMAHRPECVIVAGKTGLRGVASGEALAPCKLCDPYAVAAN